MDAVGWTLLVVVGLINLLSTRDNGANERIDSAGVVLQLHAVTARRLASLRPTHLCQMEDGAEVLELTPLYCWPQGEGTIPDQCMCAECQHK